MKYLLKSILLCFLIIGISCASSKYNYQFENNQLYSNNLVFTLNNESEKTKIVREGPNVGPEVVPDMLEVFRKSVEDLSKDLRLPIEHQYTRRIKSSTIYIEALITEINWEFTATSANMKTHVNYIVLGDTINRKVVGSFKNMWGGSESYNLRRSLTDAHYQLLKELDSYKFGK